MIGAETPHRSYKNAWKKWMGKIMIVEHIPMPIGCRNSKTVNEVTGYTKIHESDYWYYVGAEVEIVGIGQEYGEYDNRVLICPANSPEDFDCEWTAIWNLSPNP